MTNATFPLGELADITSGFAFKSELFNTSGGGLPLVRIRDVVDGVSETYYAGDYKPDFIVENGDALIGMDGQFNLARWRGGKALLNQRVCRVKATDGRLDQDYLLRFLPAALKDIEDKTPFVTVKHLSVKAVREIEVPLPPLREQRRIAAILDKADALRAKRREAIVKLDQLLQSVFLEMFGDPVTNPKGWPQKELWELCDIGDRVNYGVVQPGENFSEGVPLIRVGDIDGGRISFSSIKTIDPKIEKQYGRSRLKGNELLISCVGSIGTIATVPAEAKGYNIARAITRIPLANPRHRQFVRECLRSRATQRYFAEKTRTVSQPTLNVSFIKNAAMICPPEPLITKFCQVSDTVEKMMEDLVISSRKLDSLFSSNQHSLFLAP